MEYYAEIECETKIDDYIAVVPYTKNLSNSCEVCEFSELINGDTYCNGYICDDISLCYKFTRNNKKLKELIGFYKQFDNVKIIKSEE